MSGEEIICGCGDHLTGCDYPVVGARCPTCAMLDRDEIEWLQQQCEMLTKERDEAQAEIMRLKIRLTYVSVECDWYREACEEWLRHSHGCAADVGDEYKCKCGLRKWLAEDKRRRETVYKEGERR